MTATIVNASTPYKARIRMLTSRGSSGNQNDLVFFATLAMRLEPVEKAGLGTVGTDGKNFYYDPVFWAKCSLDEQIGLWAHEVMHVATGTLFRRQNRDHQLWNAASDYAINPQLIDFGLKLPKEGLLDNKFRDMSAEAIYAILYKDAKKVPTSCCSGHEPATDDKKDGTSNGDTRSLKELESEWKQATIAAAAVAREAGKLPAGLESLVEGLLPKINWRERLRLWLGMRSKTEYKFSPASRRYRHLGLQMPSMTGQQLDLVWIMDTSGSMDDELLAQGLGEVRCLRQKIRTTLRILHVDTEVAKDQYFGVHDVIPRKLTWKGRGGTNLQVAFDYLKDKAYPISGVVCMTDGYTYPAPIKSRLNVPLLWLLTPSHTGERFYEQGESIKLS